MVCPLCVVDIAARAQDDADTQVTPDDIKAWEAAHGPIPAGACVAMRSGFDAHVASDKFRNADAEGVVPSRFSPGCRRDAPEGRQVVGIGVDSLSLDYGKSKDFAVHRSWLPTSRWGIECIAGLGALPASGATLMVGAPKVKGATGGPARVRWCSLDDIMATRGVPDVNNFWKYLAHDPVTLRRTWASLKEVMQPGALDPLVKEMIYLAVSIANGCDYCIASHSAAARREGPDHRDAGRADRGGRDGQRDQPAGAGLARAGRRAVRGSAARGLSRQRSADR